jgi:hypothetical protein
MHNAYPDKKFAQNFWATSVIIKKLPKVPKQSPNG